MSQRFPRKNTLKFEFNKSTRSVQPSSYEVHDWIADVIGITSDQVHTAYYDLEQYTFFVKVLDPLLMERILLKFGDGVEFRHRDKTVSTVHISVADAQYKNIRVYNLPPEVENCYLKEVISQYGVVKTIRTESWSSKHRLQCYNATRVVEMQVKSNIPSHIDVFGYRVQVSYTGQTPTCFICNQSGHLRQDCPRRVFILKNNLQQRRKLTFSDVLITDRIDEPVNDTNPGNSLEPRVWIPKDFPPLPSASTSAPPSRSSVSSKNKRQRVADDLSSDDESCSQLVSPSQQIASGKEFSDQKEVMEAEPIVQEQANELTVAIQGSSRIEGEQSAMTASTAESIQSMDATVSTHSVEEPLGKELMRNDSDSLLQPEVKAQENMLSKQKSLSCDESIAVQQTPGTAADESLHDARRRRLKPPPNLAASRQAKSKSVKNDKNTQHVIPESTTGDSSTDLTVKRDEAIAMPSQHLVNQMDVMERNAEVPMDRDTASSDQEHSTNSLK